MDLISGLSLGVGLLGSLNAESQEEIDKRYYDKIRRKARKNNKMLADNAKRNLNVRNRQNNAGLVSVNERIQRQKGIEGTSAGLGAINRGLAQNAKGYNTAVNDLDSQYLRREAEIDKIQPGPSQSNENLYGDLFSFGLEGYIGGLDDTDAPLSKRRKRRINSPTMAR